MFDFTYAARAFFDPDRIIQADTRYSYCDDRYQLMGKIEQRLFVVVYTPRKDALRIIFARKANQREVDTMKIVRIRIDPASPVKGRIDSKGVDATTEEELFAQQAADEAQARQDAARFVRRVRKRLGLSQADFSSRINVSVDTIRNWEQVKRCPTGAAKSLMKVLDQAPEAALMALD